jgi:hypothetical protein
MSVQSAASRAAIRVAWLLAATLLGPAVAHAADPVSPDPDAPEALPRAAAEVESDTAAAQASEPAAAATVASAAPGERVVDRLKLDVTAITGNRELPKVMSIVPWKPAEPPAGPDRPMGSLIEELLTPLDRDEFRREITYYRDLTSQSTVSDGEIAGPPVPAVAPEPDRASPSSPPGASIP